jgi:hypothetical protein
MTTKTILGSNFWSLILILQLVEGVGTIACALVSAFILLDFPSTSKRLTVAERGLAIARLESENVNTVTEDTPIMTSWEAMRKSAIDWRTWLFTLGYTVCLCDLWYDTYQLIAL